MASEIFNATEAEAALKNALSENEELVNKFNDTNKKVADAFNAADGIVKGKMADHIGNAWVDGSGQTFTQDLQRKTEDFLAVRVNEILQTLNENAAKTENAYSGISQQEG